MYKGVQPRIIPTLLLDEDVLVKTTKFKNSKYIGDPVNTVKIFNEFEVDELCILDITQNLKSTSINFNLLKEISEECFMPLSYGGGIRNIKEVEKLFSLGFEKVIINSAAFKDLELLKGISKQFGNQALIGAIDVNKNLFGKLRVTSHSGKKSYKYDIFKWIDQLIECGIGEILLTSIYKEGTWEGMDFELIEQITSKYSVPVIAHGGCSSELDIRQAILESGAQAVAIGNLCVYQGRNKGVLISVPKLEKILSER